MIFHSFDFIVFLLAVVAVYWRLPHRPQQYFLLAASYFFYGYVHPWFLLLILASTSVDYLCALALERYPGQRKKILILSLAVNLGLLGVFKYFNFFIGNLAALLGWLGLPAELPVLQVLLPVGISFYTFQSMSYTIDVYRGALPPCRRFVDLALYVGFFPQLVAGPIERATRLLPKLQRRRVFSLDDLRDGLFLMLWGFFKKLVIADNVALIVNNVFQLRDPPFFVLWAGVFAFCIQIYADFSAYTDIARGTARLLGIELTRNFDHPYLATSPADFWRRWHISLSTWIRDYVYIPLGGSRGGPVRAGATVLVTFFLCGLWHGANWNFILWGVYHGLLIIGYRVAGADGPPPTGRLPLLLRTLLMFLLTNIGWLIFRETELSQLLHDLLLSPFDDSGLERRFALFLFAKALIFSLPLWLHAAYDHYLEPRLRSRYPVWMTVHAGVAGLLFAGILILRSDTLVDFIYFQF